MTHDHMPFLPPDLRTAARLLWQLPSYLRRRIGHEEARAILADRLARRGERLLARIDEGMLPFPDHPCRRLLEHAGCEAGDVGKLIDTEGVEGTLRRLFQAGVYLTGDEAKGRCEVVRGSLRFRVEPDQLRNRRVGGQLVVASSGSRGRPTSALLDLDGLLESCVNTRLDYDARGAVSWRKALWTIPGPTGFTTCLRGLVTCGASPEVWFSLIDGRARDLQAGIRLGPTLAALTCRALGHSIPTPRYAPLDEPSAVLEWLERVRREAGVPLISTYPSAALGLCKAAAKAGVELRGVKLALRGEPLTAARRKFLTDAGIESHVIYGSAELSIVGYGCVSPAMADEVHLMHDLVALVQAEAAAPLPRGALVLTPLAPTAGLAVLNLSIGDTGVVERRPCGCPHEQYGWTTRLHTIRSFEKLNAGGMTFADTDLIAVLEDVLPARFGGTPLCYQLVEEEAADGRPRLILLVHPDRGPLDESAVADAFLEAIASLGPMQRVMSKVWRDTDVLRVARAAPESTPGGKVLHLHSRAAGGRST